MHIGAFVALGSVLRQATRFWVKGLTIDFCGCVVDDIVRKRDSLCRGAPWTEISAAQQRMLYVVWCAPR